MAFRSSICALLVLLATSASAEKTIYEYEKDFQAWAVKYAMTFSAKAAYDKAFETWVKNEDLINAMNSMGASYTVAHNQFSHLTQQEFADMMLSTKVPTKFFRGVSRVEDERVTSDAAPASVDWSEQEGMVSPVKNQEQCGSCWAFSTTGSIESAIAISTGKMTPLSEQQLVDCDTYDQGCNGGLMDNAFQWIEKNDGLCSEEDYAYTGVDGSCKRSCSPVATISGYKDVRRNSESALEAAVAQQPVSVAIEADQAGFQFYSSGVFTGRCGTNLDHGVLVVGYGEADGQKYWKVKNSWGTTWGEAGYIRMVKDANKNRGAGQCGIASQPSYPIA